MRSIDHFDLRSFDLNLLIAFDALMEERSVTRAAARLRIRQPAMSHSLSVLRMLLQDELFVRDGSIMRPTARALNIAPAVRSTLRQMEDILRWKEPFDPGREDRTFRLGFSSDVELLVMPDLTAQLRRIAPGIRLLGRQAESADIHRLLDEGELDLAVGCFTAGASRYRGRHLFEQTLSCCFNPKLLDLSVPIGLEAYVSLGHALVTLRDDLRGCLADALLRSNAELNVVVASSNFLTVLSIASQAPVLATLPSRMAQRYAPGFGLTVSPVPLEMQVAPVAMVWSARADREPGSAWLRSQIRQILAGYATASATTASGCEQVADPRNHQPSAGRQWSPHRAADDAAYTSPSPSQRRQRHSQRERKSQAAGSPRSQ
jgi:LysR family transcriptional regulator, mexEF-oprN operon transcriptional activator